jgi:hypothetical protein
VKSVTERRSCGLVKEDMPTLKGYQLFLNYIRPHDALDGQTPADLTDIRIKGENEWLTQIQNAIGLNS